MFYIAFDGDRETGLVRNLCGAYDHRHAEAGEGADILPLWREPIDNIGGEPAEHAYREIQAVRHFKGDLVFVDQSTPAFMME